MQKFGIIGAGAWGTALAQTAAAAGRDVVIWAREEAVAQSINADHENTMFLPGIRLNPAIRATTDLAAAVESADALLVVTPAQHMRATLQNIRKHISPGVPVVLCSKGVEIETGVLMTQIAEEILPEHPLAVMSGPTFAKEVAQGLPAAIVVASTSHEAAKSLAEALSSKTFRPYVIDDPISAEVGGAVKNVIAIACGIVEGGKLGDSARAAIMTRGLAEITRLAAALGGKRETLLGLSGVGDLTLTCTSMTSRNFSLGFMLGEGKSLNEILAGRRAVTEGIATAAAVAKLARNIAVEMPICEAIDGVLNNGASIEDTIKALTTRPLRAE